jgi:hypothetical protein
MPTVQFVQQAADPPIHLTRSFPTPKRVGDLGAWYRACQKAVPQIPNVTDYNISRTLSPGPGSTSWSVLHHDISPDYIKWELRSARGEKAQVVVARRTSMFSRS